MKIILTGLFSLFIGIVYGQSPLIEAEYYIENDPGYGNGTSITISGYEDAIDSQITNNFELGQHTLYLRCKTVNGDWGMDEAVNFTVYENTTVAEITPITAAEYYFNQDPGYGEATPISIAEGFDITLSELIPNDLPLGLNTATIRPLNEAGEWGIEQTVQFIHYQTSTSNTTSATAVIGYEYYIGDDPGIGDGMYVSEDESTEIIIQEWLSSLGYTNGTYTLGIRPRGNNNVWGLSDWVEFEYLECEESMVVIEGPSEFCQGSGINLTAPENYDLYVWNTHDTSEVITIYEGGEFDVTVYNEENHQCFQSNELDIEMISTLDPTFELTQSFNIINLDADVIGQNLTWEIDGNEVGSENSFGFTFDVDGEHTICLEVANLCGVFESCEIIEICSDSETPLTFYLDSDEDGYGSSDNSLEACELPLGYASLNGDCDDSNPEINPGAIEIENDGIDQNCDGDDFISGLTEMIGKDFLVYPNPTRGLLNVSFTQVFNGEAHIYNMQGKQVFQTKINDLMELEIEMSSYGSGYYLLRIFNENQQVVTRISVL